MQRIYEHVKAVLESDPHFAADGKLLKNTVMEAALQLKPELLRLLTADTITRQHFFEEVDGVLVFDKVSFQRFISNKQFLPDSYTSFKNKIGLTANHSYLTEAKEVVLSFPYKDCVLEGGQARNEQRRQEVFWNETLAPDEIDRLLEPKVLTNWKKVTAAGEQEVTALSKHDNYLIKGNNLVTLHTLRQVYRSSIKLIYIDPPYNTGKDSFCYNDSFNHSAWLTFMKNRLEIARELLTRDGVIFISIDVNEQAYLKVLCDEIFGRDNFVGEIIWETATDNNATQISVEHEYVLCYARDKGSLPKWQIQSEKARLIMEKYEQLKAKHGEDTNLIEKHLRNWINSVKKTNEYDLSGVAHYTYVDEQGVFYPGNSANTKPGGYDFDIAHPVTGKVCSKPANGYRWPADTFWKADQAGNVLWGEDETTIPKIKKRIETATELLKGYFYEDNRKSTSALSRLMGEKVFDNPKSINLLKKIIKFSTSENDIVLDFFAGSGSTAQAVLEVNQEQGTSRTFILCEQMDYIEEVTRRRIQKVLGEDSLTYCELAGCNQNLIEKVQSCYTPEALRQLAAEVLASPFVTYSLAQPLRQVLAAVQAEDSVENLRRALIAVLDKNWLYVPYAEMDDADFGFSEVTKRLTHQFYKMT
ncbi:DNA methyltransferase [Pontibacter mangrovi]|uniref:site-specific DNA-methyltransferase (adenine-specific) n=1 Tax=Pontibacter mangrovi TaxID=2589816 RepID=A0A501VZX7_9BACT|nr:site-specific DNA-methyltransferase [Pontibacter mangrovi]TPE43273.1 site-specific DNA-methyltransferase [Pontibacter mangrovi]